MPLMMMIIGSDAHISRVNSSSDARYDEARYDMDRYDLIDALMSQSIVRRNDLWAPDILGAELRESSTGAPQIKQISQGLR